VSEAVVLAVDFCGEITEADPIRGLTVGRDADLIIDENQFLHRRLLHFTFDYGMWWVANVGSKLSVTVSDSDGRLQAWLAPSASLPMVLPLTAIRFTAGPTTYEIEVTVSNPAFVDLGEPVVDAGTTTIGAVVLTPDQRRLIVALAEPILRRTGRNPTDLPSSAIAADRLGWTGTKFNRKLDNVCQKFEKLGVRGMHGGPGVLASNRRARLVEYAVASRLITAADLSLLDQSETVGIG
jgi:hypothetical protein